HWVIVDMLGLVFFPGAFNWVNKIGIIAFCNAWVDVFPDPERHGVHSELCQPFNPVFSALQAYNAHIKPSNSVEFGCL
ncbi:hypothetical protein H9Q71_014457, partial [Fusarium xylarioides]